MREIKVEFPQNCPIRTRIYRVTKAPIHWHEGVLEIVFPLSRSRKTTRFSGLSRGILPLSIPAASIA